MVDKFKNLREGAAHFFDQDGRFKLVAKDAMIKPVFLLPDDETATILKKLRREDTNACVVVNKDKQFVGEISDEDIIRLFLQQVESEPLVQELNHGYRREFLYKNAKDLVNKHKTTVELDTPINEVIKAIYTEKFSYIPVLNTKKQVVGVITPSSIIDLLMDR